MNFCQKATAGTDALKSQPHCDKSWPETKYRHVNEKFLACFTRVIPVQPTRNQRFDALVPRYIGTKRGVELCLTPPSVPTVWNRDIAALDRGPLIVYSPSSPGIISGHGEEDALLQLLS